MSVSLDPPRTADALTPAPIVEIAAGHMAAKHLFAAAGLGLFEAIEGGARTVDDLSARLAVPAASVRMSADAMVALGLLEHDGESYRNSAAAAAFLAGRPGADLRPFLRFWDTISYPLWRDFEHVLRTRETTPHHPGEEERRVFADGVEAITAGAAHALPAACDLGTTRRLIDVGGGTGSFLRPLLAAYPELEATLVELPATAAIARQKLAGLDRVDVVDGDAVGGALPTGHHAALLANVIHLFSPDTNRRLLRNVRAALDPGAPLLLVDFWTNAEHTAPVAAALLAGEFLLVTGQGDVYSVEELEEWLRDTGFAFREQRELAGPQSLVLAEAV